MKRLLLPALMFLAGSPLLAQVGIGTTTPNAHAVLDLRSPNNNQGVLVPTMTTAQRTATTFTSTLAATEGGLLVYDSDLKVFLYWNGTAWDPVQHGTGGGGGGAPSGPAGGDLTGAYPNPTIGIGKVTSSYILDGTLLNADISTTAGIQDSKLATIATPGKVLGNAITSGTIGGSTAINTTGSIATTSGITATSTATAISGITTNTNGGFGIYGEGTGVQAGRIRTYSYAVYGKNPFGTTAGYIGGAAGVFGSSTNGTGVSGQGNTGIQGGGTGDFSTGVYGSSPGNSAFGVYGSATGNTSYGVYGEATGTTSYGVYGIAPAGVGSYGVYSSGPAGGSTTWSAVSDKRYKKNISTLENSLQKVMAMRGVSYDWRYEEFPKKNFIRNHDIGVIAQEVKEILPEVVLEGKDGYFSVSYEKIVPVLIEAIKQQQTKIVSLEKDHEELALLKTRMAAIEAMLVPASDKITSLKAAK